MSTHSCSNSSTCINIDGAYKCLKPSTTPPSTTSRNTTIATTYLTTTTTSTTTTSTTTTTVNMKTWILVISLPKGEYNGQESTMIINGNGQSKKTGFSYGWLDQLQVIYPCSIVWRGAMFLFGGNKIVGREISSLRQISKVENCQIKKYGELSFDLVAGGCAQRNNEKVFLCFDQNSLKNCYESTGPLSRFTKLRNSRFDHGDTQIAVTEG